MANIPGFLSPRSDLTIRGVPLDKMEALMNAAVDIIGGVIQFSETAIYESEQPTQKKVIDIWLQCSYPGKHEPHVWNLNDLDAYSCPGLIENVNV
jgi:hypothetical protein